MHIPSSRSVVASAFSAPTSGAVASIQIFRYSDFDSSGNGFLALSTNMYRAGNRYSLVTVDEKGRKIADCYIGQEILDMSAGGRYIAVLTPGKLTIYTHTLDVYHETTNVTDATSVVMREDGSVLVMGGGNGRLYIP